MALVTSSLIASDVFHEEIPTSVKMFFYSCPTYVRAIQSAGQVNMITLSYCDFCKINVTQV